MREGGRGPIAQDPREGCKGMAFTQNKMGAMEGSVQRRLWWDRPPQAAVPRIDCRGRWWQETSEEVLQ